MLSISLGNPSAETQNGFVNLSWQQYRVAGRMDPAGGVYPPRDAPPSCAGRAGQPPELGATVVCYACQVIFPMAEAAVTRELFQAILHAIERLRLPAGADA